MSAAASAPALRRRPASAVSGRRLTDATFLAAAFCVTFEKLHWNVAGTVAIADVVTILFLLAFAVTASRDRRVAPRTVAIVLGFFAAFLLVYLLGFFNLETKQGLDQFGKGMA